MESYMMGCQPYESRRKHRTIIWAIATVICLLEMQMVHVADASDRSLVLPREFQRRSLTESLSQATAEELSAAIGSLYNLDLGADERLASAEQVRALLRDQSLVNLRTSVNRRVDLITAGIRAEQIESISAEELAAVNVMVVAANRFEDTCSATDADAVRTAWQQLKPNAGIMAVMRPVFMAHYFNHNMHVTLSEPMLSRFVSDYQTRSGSIAECILGAWVTGSQVTDATVSADIKHSADSGHFLLQLDGNVSTNTRGRRKPATIFTRGKHTFRLGAPVFFDGERLTTGEASIDVDANNQTVAVKTDVDWIPLFGALARKIARKKARQKHGQSENIAAQKITNRVLPEFVEEVNERFSKANASIQDDLFAGLRKKNVGPDLMSSRSSESHLSVSSRTSGTARLGGTAQQFGPLPERGVAVQLHETAVNNLIDGLELGGRSIREDEFRDELSKSISDLFQREIKLGDGVSNTASSSDEAVDAEKGPPATFVFDETDPVRVRIEQDVIVLVLQVKIEEEGKDALPKHRIEVPIGISIVGPDIVLSPPEKLTDIRTTALEPVNALKRAGIANQIRRILIARLPERKVDGSVSVTASDTRDIELQTIALSGQDGWLYVELQ